MATEAARGSVPAGSLEGWRHIPVLHTPACPQAVYEHQQDGPVPTLSSNTGLARWGLIQWNTWNVPLVRHISFSGVGTTGRGAMGLVPAGAA